MRKQSPARLLFIVLLLFFTLPQAFARASGTSYGSIKTANRNDTDTAFSCDVSLSGHQIEGSVFAVLFSESKQVKSVAEYPAEENFKVSLQGVSKTDYIRILWTDENHMPLANPVSLIMLDHNKAAYEQFAQSLAQLEELNFGYAEDDETAKNPYALARLLVSCDPLPDMSRYTDKVKIISGPDNFYVLQFNDQSTAKDCEKYLKKCPSVRYAEPDAVLLTTDDKPAQSVPVLQGDFPYLSWGVEKTGIGDYASDLQKRGITRSVVVAVIDSGVDATGHPSLQGRLIDGYDYIEVDDEPQDQHGHGTHVASTIVDCTPGMDVKIMPVRVLNAFAAGSHLHIISGINYAISHKANIINLSLSVSGRYHEALEDAINRAISAGITVVTAAGNQKGFAKNCCPAHMKDCITVAAVNDKLKRFDLSNYGDAVDIAAPGEDVEGFLPGGRKGPLSGTSMATPHVSAAAALLMCDFGTGLTPAQISDSLRSKAAEIPIDEKDDAWKFWRNYGETSFLGAGFLNMRPFVQSGLYALLYADGEMVFQKSSTPDPDRELVQTYPVAASGDSGGEYAAWHQRRSEIRKVTFAEPVKPTSTALWFYDCENLSEIAGLANLDTSELTDMSQMFARCSSLTTLDLSAWNTGRVTNMRQMFFRCGALSTVYASGAFNVSRVTDSRDMFTGCAALPNYDPAHTDKAYARIGAPGYFSDKNAPKPEPSNGLYAVLYGDGELVFQNSNRTESGRRVTKTYAIDSSAIYGDPSYAPWYDQRKSIHAVNFAEKVSPGATAFWFYECENLERVNNIRNLDTSGVTSMSHMFTDCAGLPTLDLSGFHTANVTDMNFMFHGCSVLTELNVSGFNTASVTAMASMFSNCGGLTALDVSGFDTTGVTNMSFMFYGCSNLQTIYASDKFTTSSMTSGFHIFDGCTPLVGGAGTQYDGDHTDISYARIDGGTDAPGYFTDKNGQGDAPILPGDVNGDGTIDRLDLDMLSEAVEGTRTLTDREFAAADMNGDNIVDLTDYVLLTRYLDPIRGVPTVTLGSASVTLPANGVSNLRAQEGVEAEVLTADSGAPMFHVTWTNAENGVVYTVLIAPEDELPTEENVVYMNMLEAKDGLLDFTAYPREMAAGTYRILISGQDGGITQAATFDIGGAASVGIPVSVENMSDLTWLAIEVTYPENALASPAVTDKKIFQQEAYFDDNANSVKIIWSSPERVAYSGELCTIYFDVPDGAKAGTYEIGVAVDAALDSAGQNIYCTPVNGTLTIER